MNDTEPPTSTAPGSVQPAGHSVVGRSAISTSGLSKRSGSLDALKDLDLEVPVGTVFGFLGPNGAGKSTTIRLLMGLLRPSAGSATVLGLDIVHDRRALHLRVGYLPGDFAAYRHLRGQQYLDQLATLRGGVDGHEVAALAERFGLDLGRRVGELSRGNRQKLGIIQAVMHRPELMVFDEPTSGLDPLMQREFLELVRERRQEGRTVFLSSHALTEVEEVADRVAIVREGRLVMTSDVMTLKARARRRIELTFADGAVAPVEQLAGLASVAEVEVVGRTVRLEVEGSMAELLRVAAPWGIDRVISNDMDLEDVFLRYYDEEER